MATELLDSEIPSKLTDQTTDNISHETLRGAAEHVEQVVAPKRVRLRRG